MLKEYCSRLLKKTWLLATGGVGFLVTLVVEVFFPSGIVLITYLAMLVVALIAGGYSVFADLAKESEDKEEQYKSAIAELESKLAELEDRQPRLILFFKSDNGEWHQHCTISVQPQPQEPDIDELVQHESEQLDRDFAEWPGSGEPPEIGLSALIAQTMLRKHKDPEKYKAECRTYIKQFREYWQYAHMHRLWSARLRSLHFRIENNGRAPAEDVVLLIHFPDGFYFPTEEEYADMLDLTVLQPPERPKPYESPLEELAKVVHLSPNSLSSRSFTDYMPDVGLSNVSGPFINRGGSTEIRYEIDNLAHGLPIELKEIDFLVFEEAVNHCWELKYSIHARELPVPTEGILLLEVRLEEN
jgi:hypothetical protein